VAGLGSVVFSSSSDPILALEGFVGDLTVVSCFLRSIDVAVVLGLLASVIVFLDA
jgi:hypothetical protein